MNREDDLQALKLLLETQKLQRDLEKVEAETKILARQNSLEGRGIEWIKSFTGLSAVITGLVALLGLWLSVSRWQGEVEQTREAGNREQLGKAFDDLADNSVGKRLSGLSKVHYFLLDGNDVRQRQILQTMVDLLAIERQAIVRDSMISLLRSLRSTDVSKTTSAETIAQLVTLSRTLVGDAKLRTTRTTGYLPIHSDSEEAIAASVGEAIVALLRVGGQTKDLSWIYCLKCDFSGLDLSSLVVRRDWNFDGNAAGAH